MKAIHYTLLLTALLGVTLWSCDSDDTSVQDDSGITFVLKTTGDQEPEYVISQSDIINDSISAVGTGFESIDWNFSHTTGRTLFVIGYTNFEANVYQRNEANQVERIASFILETPLEVFGNVNDETMLALDAPRDGTHSMRNLSIVSAETGLVTDKKSISIYDVDNGTPGEGVIAWPVGLQVVGNKLFIPFYLVDDAGFYSTPVPNGAHVAVYSYPDVESEPIKVIQDDRTANIGVNGSSNGLIQNESGDLYSFSSGAYLAGFSPRSTKPSGILKINSGETEFDESYFFDVTNAENGGILYWMDYAGNGKALARVLTEDVDPANDPEGQAAWGAFGRSIFNQKLVVIDLESQTITPVENVPLHAKRYTSPLLVENGQAYVSIETAGEAYVYQVDVEAATAVRGSRIQGKTIKGFSRL